MAPPRQQRLYPPIPANPWQVTDLPEIDTPMSGTEEFLTPDQLIQRYLDGETNAVQEKRFRLLLGEESFREQVAHYATDFAQLHDLARQGLLDITACGWCDRRRPVTFRRVAAITAAACVVLAMATSWLLRSPNGPAPKPPLAKGLAPLAC